ncbi:Crp/Fnr family transcriptional regulator [Hydrogenophaga sp. PAMC20947]|uniref:Crp/Fnr family transcriptional regulator n=1 Tax=Hydrogenophaga sp. PAMC20947 TaxID=2565558 RepID=UPI00109E1D28|nr:Crp/Fnr family transcriptional regulator [Hydrogenophaga sp. PAMC20947]QCB45558.1 Crp/Fnr family transcriptional regulator [Hydrogenophaga sp. PAMC20947]
MQTALPSRPHSPSQNHLLAALPQAEYEALAQYLEPMTLALGDMIYEPGEQLQHACFPTTAVVSLYYVTVSGAAAESAGVGNEGMVGISLFMGGDTTPSSAVVQTAGHGYRLDRHRLRQAFDGAGSLQGLLLRYTLALITQVSQTAVCNRHHSVEQQLSRWLLLTLDRGPPRELVMTQELVAGILGVRRESVTAAAGNLLQMGYIRYRRGHISVVDPKGLQTCACECYGVVKKELGRLLGGASHRPETVPCLQAPFSH